MAELADSLEELRLNMNSGSFDPEQLSHIQERVPSLLHRKRGSEQRPPVDRIMFPLKKRSSLV